MHVLAEQSLRMPVEQAFAALSDPDVLDRLVPMRVERVNDVGSGAAAQDRRVSMFGLLPMEETIVEVTAGEVIRYRISPQGPLRAYEGVQRFTSTPTGSSVSWEIRFRTVVPLLDRVTAAGLRMLMRRALAKLDGLTP